MKLLQLLAYILPKKWFVALLASKYCKSIRLRLLSRSYSHDHNITINFKLYYQIYKIFRIHLSIKEIEIIFRMKHDDAVKLYGARETLTGSKIWWNYDDPNRQKYHTYLFLIQ